ERGGLIIVQDPETAEVAYMPQAAMAAIAADYVLALSEIGRVLLEFR
ncbi:MAG: chemotaxis protein CheB, partial [Anaerolineae bacterium]|nr:chemotaxis protein CheB [Anaerolineae bacterium]